MQNVDPKFLTTGDFIQESLPEGHQEVLEG